MQQKMLSAAIHRLPAYSGGSVSESDVRFSRSCAVLYVIQRGSFLRRLVVLRRYGVELGVFQPPMGYLVLCLPTLEDPVFVERIEQWR
jgi:hypothetical protein